MQALYQTKSEDCIQCLACAHRCVIHSGHSGFCKIRSFQDGVFRVPAAELSSLALDPIEKKPLYHFHPGVKILSFGGIGCNFHCPFCQNWEISQVGRDPQAEAGTNRVTDEALLEALRVNHVNAIASTYNEPFLSIEWTAELFAKANACGVKTVLVSNGFATPESLNLISPVLDAANIDLKCFSEEHYRTLGGSLKPVLDTITELYRRGIWLEVTTLVVPGFNDSEAELRAIAGFLAGLSVDIPWHVSAFYHAYKIQDNPSPTPLATMRRAVEIGHEAGLHYVYSGNLRGGQGAENTLCPQCGKVLIRRNGFEILKNDLQQGCCRDCGLKIAGEF